MITQATSAAMKYPGCTERLRKAGFPSLARMAEILPTPKAIDKALGYDTAASHWLSGRNNTRPAAEAAAAMWLQIHDKAETPTIATKEQPTGTMLLVITDQPDKVRRVLSLIGCEVEEV